MIEKLSASALLFLLPCVMTSAHSADSDLTARAELRDPPECAGQLELTAATPTYDEAALEILKSDPTRILKAGYWDMPEHISVDFSGCLGVDRDWNSPALRVFRIDEFAGIFSPNPVDPRGQSFVEEKDVILHWISGDPGSSGKPVPGLLMMDASVEFWTLAQQTNIVGGQGRRALVRYEIEPGLVTNIAYEFHGVSDDGELYANFLVNLSLDGLAEEVNGSHLGYSAADVYADQLTYALYMNEVRRYVEANQEQIVPSLASLDRFVTALKLVRNKLPTEN